MVDSKEYANTTLNTSPREVKGDNRKVVTPQEGFTMQDFTKACFHQPFSNNVFVFSSIFYKSESNTLLLIVLLTNASKFRTRAPYYGCKISAVWCLIEDKMFKSKKGHYSEKKKCFFNCLP